MVLASVFLHGLFVCLEFVYARKQGPLCFTPPALPRPLPLFFLHVSCRLPSLSVLCGRFLASTIVLLRFDVARSAVPCAFFFPQPSCTTSDDTGCGLPSVGLGAWMWSGRTLAVQQYNFHET